VAGVGTAATVGAPAAGARAELGEEEIAGDDVDADDVDADDVDADDVDADVDAVGQGSVAADAGERWGPRSAGRRSLSLAVARVGAGAALTFGDGPVSAPAEPPAAAICTTLHPARGAAARPVAGSTACGWAPTADETFRASSTWYLVGGRAIAGNAAAAHAPVLTAVITAKRLHIMRPIPTPRFLERRESPVHPIR
jgi:hypothetical protein